MNQDTGQPSLGGHYRRLGRALDSLAIVLSKRMRLADHELPALAASALAPTICLDLMPRLCATWASLRQAQGPSIMNSLLVAVVALACLLAGALLGMALRARLPEHHLGQDATDVIKLAAGFMATLAALILGLLIFSANADRRTVESELNGALASAALLDRYLAAYGQDAQEARELLRHFLVRRFQARWPGDDFGPQEPAAAPNRDELVEMEQRILRLAPRDDAQKWFQSRALELANGLALARRLLTFRLAGISLPMPTLIALIVWITAIFTSFGLFVKINPTVIVALFVSALSVAVAFFLILDLNSPFTGLIHISSAPAHAILEVLDK